MRTLITQLIYFGFFQSIFLLSVYFFSKTNRKNINGYMIVFVSVLLISLSGRILYYSDLFGRNYRFLNLSEFATMLFGSTIYLFTKSSLTDKKFIIRDLVNYIPAVIYGFCIVFYYIVPTDQEMNARIPTGELYRSITIFIGIGLVFNITYWILSLDIFLNYRKKIQNELSYEVKTKFFLNFLVAIGICLLSWLTVYFISIFGFKMMERQSREIIWLSITLIILFIAYYSMLYPNLFKTDVLQYAKKYNQSKLSKEDIEVLKVKLETLMLEKKPYINKKLMKAELANMLGISNPEMARLLNECIGMNFFEYINYFRIKEFLEIAKSGKTKSLTFFAIAQDAGFNSKSTFNLAFKKILGKSPSQYFKERLNN